MYSLSPKVIVLPPGVLCPKNIVRDQMVIDLAHQLIWQNYSHQQNQ